MHVSEESFMFTEFDERFVIEQSIFSLLTSFLYYLDAIES